MYLEGEGHLTIQAHMGAGGISSADGSVRFAVLAVPPQLEPDVEYRLRPRNENERYRWSIARDVVVAAR